ncbi:hypothetical protein RAD15_43365, partial [Bradyrhizobium sp. 14AA]
SILLGSFKVILKRVKQASTFSILSLPPTATMIASKSSLESVVFSTVPEITTSSTSLPGVFKFHLIIANLKIK